MEGEGWLEGRRGMVRWKWEGGWLYGGDGGYIVRRMVRWKGRVV